MAPLRERKRRAACSREALIDFASFARPRRRPESPKPRLPTSVDAFGENDTIENSEAEGLRPFRFAVCPIFRNTSVVWPFLEMGMTPCSTC